MDYDKENIPMSVIDSPKRNKGTSKVIDQLHTNIDSLKQELSDIKLQADDYKKKYVSLNKRYDHVVDQLANSKHENDMINALLKRKERRILDLETQFGDSIQTTETLKLKNSNLEIRCANLQDASASSVAEHERLKIAYDAIVTSQNEYRLHFNKEVQQIKDNLQNFMNQRELSLLDTQQKFSSNNQEFDKLFSNLLNKSKNLENIYSNKNNTIVDALKNLAGAAKSHGEETKTILVDCNSTLSIVYKYFPEFKKSEPIVAIEDDFDSSNLSSPEFKHPKNSSLQSQQQQQQQNNSRPSSRPTSFIATGSNGLKNSTRRKRGGHKRNSSRLENYDYNANMANYNISQQTLNSPNQQQIHSPKQQSFNYNSNSPNQNYQNGQNGQNGQNYSNISNLQEINISKRNSLAIDSRKVQTPHQRNNSNTTSINYNNNQNNSSNNSNNNKPDSRKSSYDNKKISSYQHPNAKKKPISNSNKSRNSSLINPEDLNFEFNNLPNSEINERESAFQKLQGNNPDKEASDILNSLNETIGE